MELRTWHGGSGGSRLLSCAGTVFQGVRNVRNVPAVRNVPKTGTKLISCFVCVFISLLIFIKKYKENQIHFGVFSVRNNPHGGRNVRNFRSVRNVRNGNIVPAQLRCLQAHRGRRRQRRRRRWGRAGGLGRELSKRPYYSAFTIQTPLL